MPAFGSTTSKSSRQTGQRYAARRPDVLVYTSDELEQNVTVAGPITADLFVSTTGTDSDWVVKLIDVCVLDTELRCL